MLRYSVRIQLRVWTLEEVLGEVGFLQLSLDRVLRVVDVEVADQLLGDGRGALHRLAAGQQVLPGGAGDRARVEGAVLVEALVLDRDGGVLEGFRQGAGGDRLADVVGADEADQAAVGGVDRRGAALLHRFQAGERRRRVVDVQRPGSGDAAGNRHDRRQHADGDGDLVPAGLGRLAPPPADPGRHRTAIVERRARRPDGSGPRATQLAERLCAGSWPGVRALD